MNESSSRSRLYTFLLIAAILFWGANWTVMKIGLAHASPLWMVAERFLLGAACLFPFVAINGGIHLPPRQDLPIVLSVGLLQMLINAALITVALQTVPPGRSAVLAYTTPIWVTPAAALLGERPSFRKMAGTLCGLAGVAILFNPASLDWTDRRVITGHLLLLAAALTWAICIIHIRHHQWHSSALALAPWQMLLAAIPMTVLALAVDGPHPGDGSLAFWGTTLYSGGIATAFCYWAVVAVNRRISSTTMSIAMLAVPVVGLTISAVYLGERLDGGLLLGMAGILGGIAIAATQRRV